MLAKGTVLSPVHFRIFNIWGVDKILIHDQKKLSPEEINLIDFLAPAKYYSRPLPLTRADSPVSDPENTLLRQAIQDGVSLGSFETSLNQLESPILILKETKDKIHKFFHLDSLCFFLVNEKNSDLTTALFQPDGSKFIWEKILEDLIQNRFIFQAISSQKPVLISATDQNKSFIVHALATKSRTRGIFLGVLNGNYDFPPLSQLLFSMIMFSCAHMLESFELYTEIKRKNSQLKTSVERLKRTEQELRLHKQKLENLVAQRTRDLIKTNEALKLEIEERKKTEQKLLLAQKKAKKANQIKNKFLANLSHELRTPLNAILGMTELALMEKIDSQTKEYLDIAYKAAQGLSTMIDDLLDMSLIEYGQLEIKKEPFDLRKILDSVLDIFLHKAQSKGLLISSHLDPGIPELLIGDFSRLRQVLVNLVGNAIKFTDQGEIRIHVQLLKQIDEHTILLKFAVQDTGCGIPKDKMDLIFERFTQVDGSYTRQHDGTGLGLALCKKIITLLGGRIWVESMPGKGSTFYFTLPFFLED